MKEIIEIGLGSCGINLTSSYFSQINEEKKLLSSDINTFSHDQVVHFYESSKQTPIARFIFADFDPLPIDQVLVNPNAVLYNQDNLIAGNSSTNGLFPNGLHNSDYIFDQITDVIRKETERCESLQSFIINHSLSGGTGSGLTSRLLAYLATTYSHKSLINNIIIPNNENKDRTFGVNALSYYNTVLGFPYVIENSLFSVLSDNFSLGNMADDEYITNEGSFKNLNKSISKAMSALTSGSRFKGLLPLNLNKILTNCVPFPRLHFFTSSFFQDPYNKPNFINSCKENVLKNKKSLFYSKGDKINVMNSCSLYRGESFCSSELEEINRNSIATTYEWMTDSTVGHVYHVQKENSKEATFFNSGPFIGKYLIGLGEMFRRQFRRKSFLYWYTSFGMDEMEFSEAESNLNDLESEYLWNTGNSLIEEEEDFNEE